MRTRNFTLSLLALALLALTARADLEVFPQRSLEWLIDTSDVIAIATVPDQGDRKALKLEKLLKSPAGGEAKAWPVVIEKFGTVPYVSKYEPRLEPGDRVLVFARNAADGLPKAHDLVYLKGAKVEPTPSGSWKEACAAIYHGSTKDRVCVVFNKFGELLVDPVYVLACVEQRIKDGPRVPKNAEVERLESFNNLVEGAYGGFYLNSMAFREPPSWADRDGGSQMHCVLVPPEPEHISVALGALTSDYENPYYAKQPLERLSQFPHNADVVDWLKRYDAEDWAAKYESRVVDGRSQVDELRNEVKKTIELMERRAKSTKPQTK